MTLWVSRLLFANVLLFVLALAVPELSYWMTLQPSIVLREPWTVVTHMFMHVGLWHLGFNMLSLYFFGSRVEQRLGSNVFIALYFVSGLGGALLSIAVQYHAVVGASGALFGVFLVYARFWPHERILVWGVFPVEARMLVLLATVYSIFGGIGALPGGNVAHYGHLGGYVGGYLFLLWLEKTSPRAQFQRRVEQATFGATAKAKSADDLQLDRIKREGLHQINIEELDRIAEKVRTQGVASLTPNERAFVHRLSLR